MQEKTQGDKKIVNRNALQRISWIVVIVFVFTFFVLFSISAHPEDALVALCLVCLLVCLASKYDIGAIFRPDKMTPWLLFLVCFLSRLAWCVFVNPRINQVSDYSEYLRIAAGGGYDPTFYTLFSHKLIYPLLLRLLHISTQGEAHLFQCLCVSGIPPFLYHMGKRMGQGKVGVLASILYIIWPSQIAYVSIVTEEHLVALFLAAALSLIVDVYYLEFKGFEKRPSSSLGLIVRLIGAGALCGVCALFRDFAAILLIATGLCILILLPGKTRLQKKKMLLGLLVLLLTRIAVCTSFNAVIGRTTGLPMRDQVVAAQLSWSMDPDGWGGWTPEGTTEFYMIAEENRYDATAIMKEVCLNLLEKWRGRWGELPNFLLSKGVYSYGSDDAPFYWCFDVSMAPAYKSELAGTISILRFVNQVFYLFIIICILLCALFRFRESFIVLLVTIGAVIVQLPIECQGRYKYPLEPLWTLVTAYALYGLTGWAKRAVSIKTQAADG